LSIELEKGLIDFFRYIFGGISIQSATNPSYPISLTQSRLIIRGQSWGGGEGRGGRVWSKMFPPFHDLAFQTHHQPKASSLYPCQASLNQDEDPK